MDRAEVLKIMSVLRGAYPQFYRNIDRNEAEATVGLWTDMFSNDEYPLVAAAVKALIETDEKGFPPHIGAVKAKLRKIQSALPGGGNNAWMRPYVLKLAANVTELEADAIHDAGLLTWAEADSQGMDFHTWNREYREEFPVGVTSTQAVLCSGGGLREAPKALPEKKWELPPRPEGKPVPAPREKLAAAISPRTGRSCEEVLAALKNDRNGDLI